MLDLVQFRYMHWICSYWTRCVSFFGEGILLKWRILIHFDHKVILWNWYCFKLCWKIFTESDVFNCFTIEFASPSNSRFKSYNHSNWTLRVDLEKLLKNQNLLWRKNSIPDIKFRPCYVSTPYDRVMGCTAPVVYFTWKLDCDKR